MGSNIKNGDVFSAVVSCEKELEKIEGFISFAGKTSLAVPYLTRYSLIKSCGTIEVGFKGILADSLSVAHSPQVKNFIDLKFRNSSINPKYELICKSLKNFDPAWKASFKDLINSHDDSARLISSLDSLVAARNSFAHGGAPSVSFDDVKAYFSDSVLVLKYLEDAIR